MTESKGLTAVVLGATGLVGSALVQQLLLDPSYTAVVTLGRRPSDAAHERLTHHVVDFEERSHWTALVRGDAFFSTMGTTMRVAGSKEAQWRVDHDYQLWGIEAAAENAVRSVVLVSSLGANKNSVAFYSRMKGQLDEEVRALNIRNLTLLRPGMLDGDRKESRPGESFGLAVGRLLPKWDVLVKARPFPVTTVARAARAGVRMHDGSRIWEAADVFAHGAE